MMTTKLSNTVPNGGGLLGAPIAADEWTTVEDTLVPAEEQIPPAPPAATVRRGFASLVRLAGLGATGSFVTLTYAAVKLAYYWPSLQVSINTQFPCLH